MITNETALDNLSIVSRMVAYRQGKGETLEESLTAVKESLPEHYNTSVEAMARILQGDDNVIFAGYGAGPFKILAKLAALIRQEQGNVGSLFYKTKESISQAVVQAREYWSGFNALIVYLVIVATMSSLVIGIFTIQVMPTFEDIFSDFGAPLPMLTKFFISNGIILPLVMGIFSVLIILCISLSFHIRKRVVQFLPLTSFCRWVPGIRRLDEVYRYFLLVQYANSLVSGNVKDGVAFDHAKTLSNFQAKKKFKFRQWWESAEAAARMDVLTEELEYQSAQIAVLFNRQMIVVREKITLIVQISLGLLIGAIVVAMYLPIFMMGSVV